MKTRSISITVSPDIGKVSAKLITPTSPICVLTFAHGAGAGMDHTFMVTLSHALAERNVATLRFNFPFMENKKGRLDTPAVAHKTIEAAIKKARKLFPDLLLFVSGKSFGGRMTSQMLALLPESEVKGVIFFGFPLHPPGKPSIDRAVHLKQVKVPMLFLQGSRDELADYKLIEKVCKPLRYATLQKIDGANHAFKAGKTDIVKILAAAASDWIGKNI